jgi:hypothetical protein
LIVQLQIEKLVPRRKVEQLIAEILECWHQMLIRALMITLVHAQSCGFLLWFIQISRLLARFSMLG